jgi:hypothetical protein
MVENKWFAIKIKRFLELSNFGSFLDLIAHVESIKWQTKLFKAIFDVNSKDEWL